MDAKRMSAVLLCWIMLCGAAVQSAVAASSDEPQPPTAAVQSDHPATKPGLRVPLRFEPNRGQSDDSVRYLSRGPGYLLLLTDDEAILRLKQPAHGETSPDQHRAAFWSLHMEFGGRADPEGRKPLESASSYFIGQDSSRWLSRIPNFAEVAYRSIYDGIDLLFYENSEGELEFDFLLAPGANPAAIGLRFRGAETLRLDESGNLLLKGNGQTVMQRAPVSYQHTGAGQKEIETRYVLGDDGRLGFEVAEYDREKPLRIDPTIVYSTYWGRSFWDIPYGLAVDESGSAYIAGRSDTADFTGVNSHWAHYDLFVAKLKPSGSDIDYVVYLGGSDGDLAHDIAVDGAGHAYITGYTHSDDYPVANPFQGSSNGNTNAFVTKLSTDGGSILFSTYLRSESGTGGSSGESIAVDGDNNVYVIGRSSGSHFPVVNAVKSTYGGFDDGFAAKLNPAGNTLLYSTYLGGSSVDRALGLAVDGSGHAYITGSTYSGDFPTTPDSYQPNKGGAQAAYVVKLSADGSALEYSTFLGGLGIDTTTGQDIAVDALGNAYIAGMTRGLLGVPCPVFPTVNAAQSVCAGENEGFAAKFNSNGSELLFSTLLGGSGNDGALGIALDGDGGVIVTGYSASDDFPVKGAVQGNLVGAYDAFLVQLAPTGNSLVFSTYLGGLDMDFGNSTAVDTSGNVYMSGYTISSDFPVQRPYQRSNAGLYDAFVTKFGTYRIFLR